MKREVTGSDKKEVGEEGSEHWACSVSNLERFCTVSTGEKPQGEVGYRMVQIV